MADVIPEWETADKKGTTNVFTGTVGLSWLGVPITPGGSIQEFTLINDEDNLITEYIEISLDGGSTIYDRIFPSGYVSDLIKGDATTQIAIRGQSSSVKYKVILDRELA